MARLGVAGVFALVTSVLLPVAAGALVAAGVLFAAVLGRARDTAGTS